MKIESLLERHWDVQNFKITFNIKSFVIRIGTSDPLQSTRCNPCTVLKKQIKWNGGKAPVFQSVCLEVIFYLWKHYFWISLWNLQMRTSHKYLENVGLPLVLVSVKAKIFFSAISSSFWVTFPGFKPGKQWVIWPINFFFFTAYIESLN